MGLTDARKSQKITPMPRWLMWTVCVLMAILVAVICIVPGWHLYPLTLRVAALFFALMLFLSGSFHPEFILNRELIPAFDPPALPEPVVGLTGSFAPLRC